MYRNMHRFNNEMVLRILAFLVITISTCSGLYEDQIGKFDWRQQYIGQVTKLYWEQVTGTSGGKKLYVATDKNAIASLNSINGELVWRKVFEEGRRGEVDDLAYTEDLLVSVSGGLRVTGWAPTSGSLLWDVYLQGDVSHRSSVAIIKENHKGLAVALTSQFVFGLNARDGEIKWKVDLPNSDSVRYKNLLVHDGTVYVVGMMPGSEVRLLSIDSDGDVLSTKPVVAGFVKGQTQCQFVQNQFLVCYCEMSESFQVLNVRSPNQGFVATSVQDLGVSEENVQAVDWRQSLSSTANGVLVRFSQKHSALLTVNNNARLSLKKNLPKSVGASVSSYEDRDYLVSLEQSGFEELIMLCYEVSTGEELSDCNHKLHYAAHNGNPDTISILFARRSKDGKMLYKLAINSDDFSIQLIHKGKVLWRREEAVAYTAAVEMVDLPVSENQAKFEDEFGTQDDNILTMFVKRIKTQLSQLQTFLLQQLHRLQGVKHHSSMMDEELEDEEEEDLLRDDFNQHKMIILVTAPGKIIGMRSMNGHIVWQTLIPNMVPFDKFGGKKYLLYTQRTTAHFPHPPQCVVVGKSRVSGSHLYAFNPITGHAVDQMPSQGIQLTFNLQQAFLHGEMDEHFVKGLIMMDSQLKVHTYPANFASFLKSHSTPVFMFVANVDQGQITGYRIISVDKELRADSVWSISLVNQKQNLKITSITAKPHNEHVHSQGRVLGDRSVMYKYINPNAVVVVTEGEEPATTQQKAYNIINLYVLDVVTGHVIFHCNHRKAEGPVHVIHSENWVVYSYFNVKTRRPEMGALELYEGKEQRNSTSFSSFTAPYMPLVVRQSFIFPVPMYTMATTITEKGITNKDILIALKTGGVYSLPKAFLDPRRPLTPTQQSAEEGVMPYIPELPVHTEGMINYNQTLMHVRSIYTAPTGLESTSLVLVYGIDVFHTRVTPSKMFDVLKEDFEHWLIAGVVLSMLLASFITQKLAGRKALNKQWK